MAQTHHDVCALAHARKPGFPMIQAPQDNDQLARVPPATPASPTEVADADNVNVSQRLMRFARLVRRYPLPFSVIGLLLVSLIAWLAGWHDVSQWSLIVIILLGGVPLALADRATTGAW